MVGCYHIMLCEKSKAKQKEKQLSKVEQTDQENVKRAYDIKRERERKRQISVQKPPFVGESKKTLQTSVNLLCSQFSSNFNDFVMFPASRPHNCTHVHVKTLVHIYVCSRHYVMCPIS